MRLCVLFVVVGIAVVKDLKTGKVPNLLIAFGFLLWGTVCICEKNKGFMFDLVGGGEALLVLILPFALGVLGAGDVKLLALIGCFVGKNVWRVIWYSSFIAAMEGIPILLIRKAADRGKNRAAGKNHVGRNHGSSWTKIYFTIPVFLGLVLYVLREKGAWI